MVPLAEKSMLMYHAWLVLQKGKNRELVIEEHPPLFLVTRVRVSVESKYFQNDKFVSTVSLGDVLGDILHRSSVHRLDQRSDDVIAMVNTVVEG